MHRRCFTLASLLMILLCVPACLVPAQTARQQLNDALVAAVKKDDRQAVVTLLKQGADPNAREHNGSKPGNTLLLLALAPNWQQLSIDRPVDPVIVNALLDAGADPNYRDAFNETPLIYAGVRCPSQVLHLLNKGADVNAKGERNTTVLIAIFQGGVCPPGLLRLLLDRGADVNARDASGMTPLMGAAIYTDLASVRLLLARGAQANTKDKDGITVLQWAKRPLSLGATDNMVSSALITMNAQKVSEQRKFVKEHPQFRKRYNEQQEIIRLLKQAGAKE